MLNQIVLAVLLLASTVAIHAAVLGAILQRLNRPPVMQVRRFGSTTWLLIRVAAVVVLAHLLEIGAWGAFYAWRGVMPDLEVALYFSAVTYATIGYGDIVPPQHWRLIAGVEGLTGILMCSWSGGFFFAVVNRIYEARAVSGDR
jgi:voltage-gated potassium channel Kch